MIDNKSSKIGRWGDFYFYRTFTGLHGSSTWIYSSIFSRSLGLSSAVCWNFHINGYNFIIFRLCIPNTVKVERIQYPNSIDLSIFEILIFFNEFQCANFKMNGRRGVDGRVPAFQPGGRVRFPAGYGSLIPILGLVVCSVLCCLLRRPWHCADHTFREVRPCVSV